MRVHEALLYLPQLDLDPFTVIECQTPTCTRAVMLANTVAFPARIGESEGLKMAFFCSEECYLAAIPPCACPKA
jgi:hypothetical protein